MAGLKGKIVLVTGASSGIGRATALHFSGLGCRVSIVARNLDQLKTAAEECKAAGAEDVFFASHDLSTEAGCQATIEDTVKHFGGLLFYLSRSKATHDIDFHSSPLPHPHPSIFHCKKIYSLDLQCFISS